MTTSELNQREIEVLRSCITSKETEDCMSGVLFQVEDIKIEGLSRESIRGYFSSLQKKGLYVPQEDCYFSGLITNEGIQALKDND